MTLKTVQIDGYEGLVEIGRRSGIVYRAWQGALGREVAIKVLTGPPLSLRGRRRLEEGVTSSYAQPSIASTSGR